MVTFITAFAVFADVARWAVGTPDGGVMLNDTAACKPVQQTGSKVNSNKNINLHINKEGNVLFNDALNTFLFTLYCI